MSGQVFSQHDGVTLREHLEKVIHLNEIAHDRALNLAREELARRLELLNGETGRIKTILDSTLPRELAEQRFSSLEKDIKALTTFKDTQEGKASQKDVDVANGRATWAIVFSIATFIVSVVLSLVLR